mmetsp:Transcript_616/g.820  ORF Transcript_616/g.820 Transcript_616/m.820 type:complete len:96 (+) Transcript_616:20-307(+)
MLGQLDVVDDDWTTVIDDLDRYGLTENAIPLIPLSQLHRPDPKVDLDTVTDAMQEEVKQEKMTLIVQMVPAFGLKELSVYADPDQLIQIGKKYTF